MAAPSPIASANQPGQAAPFQAEGDDHRAQIPRTPGGFKVLDFTRYMPGPVASRLLTDLGADVVKVENAKTGDATRGFAPFVNGVGLFHAALNPGVRSLALDHRSPHWRTVIEAAVKWADVVLVGALPEAAAKLGIDFETVAAINPRIVYGGVSGYGEQGPWRDLPAHGLNPDAFAGLVPLDWRDGEPQPHPAYFSAGAPLSGVFLALGVLAGLRRRDHSGEAQRLHVSLYHAAIWWNWRHVTAITNLGEPWWSYGGFGGRYATYVTADEQVILVCPLEKNFWRAFCDILQLPEDWRERGDWSASGMDHGTAYPWEREEIAKRMRSRSRDAWIEAFTAAAIPFAPILSLEETLNSEHAQANRVLRRVTANGAPATIPSFPVAFAGQESAAPLAAPALGEHNAEVLAEWGLAEWGLGNLKP